MNIKLTRSGQDAARGYDNLYYMSTQDDGDWKVLNEYNRDHNCTHAMCEFKVVENIKTKTLMLLGTSANTGTWTGKEISSTKLTDMSIEQMAIFLAP